MSIFFTVIKSKENKAGKKMLRFTLTLLAIFLVLHQPQIVLTENIEEAKIDDDHERREQESKNQTFRFFKFFTTEEGKLIFPHYFQSSKQQSW